MKLDIITPVARLENVPVVSASIERAATAVDLVWWPVFDLCCGPAAEGVYRELRRKRWVRPLLARNTALAGHAHRNAVLERVRDPRRWVMSVDDDNILHPRLIEFLRENAARLGAYRGLLFDQELKDGTLRLEADPERVHVGNVDTAQFMLRRDLIGDQRFDEHQYVADGLFIEAAYARHPTSFLIVNRALCYYNYLR